MILDLLRGVHSASSAKRKHGLSRSVIKSQRSEPRTKQRSKAGLGALYASFLAQRAYISTPKHALKRRQRPHAGLHEANIYDFSDEKCASGLTKLAGKGN